MFMNSVIDLTAYLPEQPAPRRAQREDELFSTLDENPDFTAPAETPSGQAESQRPSEG